MRKIMLAVLIGGVMGQAYAGGPTINLDSQTFSATGKDEWDASIYRVDGKCGPATVRITNLSRRDTGEYRVESNSILTVDGPSGNFTNENDDPVILEDANDVVCVETPQDSRLLIAAWCMAVNCPEVRYAVIDTKSAKLLTKVDFENPCELACAEKALGMKVPTEQRTY